MYSVQCMYLTAGVRVVAVRVADVPAALLPLPGQPEHHRPGVEARCWVHVGVEGSSAVLCVHAFVDLLNIFEINLYFMWLRGKWSMSSKCSLTSTLNILSS